MSEFKLEKKLITKLKNAQNQATHLKDQVDEVFHAYFDKSKDHDSGYFQKKVQVEQSKSSSSKHLT